MILIRLHFGSQLRRAALRFTGKIRRHLAGFDIASERGTERSEVEAGLRAVGFGGSVTIAFKVYATEVVIQRVYYRGIDWTNDRHGAESD